jgi:choline dehydrogenase-like flavoprotein
MLVRPAERSPGPVRADVCVIGGGAAGVTLTLELAAADLRVALIEAGDLEPTAGRRAIFSVVPGQTVRLGTDVTRPTFLGGATNHWFGNCRPLDDVDLEAREEVPHSGWPITRGELDQYYERAQRASGLGDVRWYEPDACAPYLEHGPLPVDRTILETRMVHTCPVLSFAEAQLAKLRGLKNAEVLLGTRVLQLRTNAGGDRISSAEAVADNGEPWRIEADVFVLACGGVENACLLLSSTDAHPSGIGNEHDLVGRFFMEHWFFDLGLEDWDHPDIRLYEAPKRREGGYRDLQEVGGASVWAQLVLSQAFMSKERVPGLGIWFDRTPRDPASVTAAKRFAKSLLRGSRPSQPLSDIRLAVSDVGSVARYAARRLQGNREPLAEGFALRVELEQLPDAENRITLSSRPDALGQPEPDLNLRLGLPELEAASRSLTVAAGELGLDGSALATQLETSFTAGRFGFFFHHMGTTRMSDDPTQGVVDRNCRVHGISNLFLAGASVFPTGGTAAPTLTAVALALRLADDLSRQDGALVGAG